MRSLGHRVAEKPRTCADLFFLGEKNSPKTKNTRPRPWPPSDIPGFVMHQYTQVGYAVNINRGDDLKVILSSDEKG
jgi:hypothetical protein